MAHHVFVMKTSGIYSTIDVDGQLTGGTNEWELPVERRNRLESIQNFRDGGDAGVYNGFK